MWKTLLTPKFYKFYNVEKRTVSSSCLPTMRRPFLGTYVILTDTAFHLELDEAVHFDRVLHRKFFSERFNEAHNDHLRCLSFGQTAAHEVEQLILGHLGYRCFMLKRNVVIHD